MTFKEIKARIKQMGLTVRKDGDGFVLNYPRGGSATAYHISDPAQLFASAEIMSRNGSRRL